MTKTLFIRTNGAILLSFMLLLPVHALPQTIKITVISPDAVVYSEPDTASQVIQSPTKGTVLEAEPLIGDWYKVKVSSKVGMSITGYIHKQWVQPEKTAQDTPQKEPSKSTPATRMGQASPARSELALRFGMSSGSFLNERSMYSETWSLGILDRVNETGSISHKISNPLGIGLGFAYKISGGFGVQLKLDYNFTAKVKDESTSTFNMDWTWANGDGPYNASSEWPVSGEVSVMPVSLNVIYKFQEGGFIVPYVSGGASYIIGNVKLNSMRGTGISWEEGDLQYIDYIDIPIQIDESISHLGFNVGGGLDLMFSSNVGLNLDACYYIGKKTELNWMHRSGTYSGNLFPGSSWSISQENIDALNQQVSPVEVNTSFFKLQAGIKLLF